MLRYNDRLWLNDERISSTGSIVCYSGESSWKKPNSEEPEHTRFVEIADCHSKVRIHQSDLESLQEYIDKIREMKKALERYIQRLEVEKN